VIKTFDTLNQKNKVYEYRDTLYHSKVCKFLLLSHCHVAYFCRPGADVTIQTKLRTGRSGFDFQHGQWRDLFLFVTPSRLALGPTQSAIQWVKGTRPGIKRLGREGNSPPSSDEATNEW